MREIEFTSSVLIYLVFINILQKIVDNIEIGMYNITNIYITSIINIISIYFTNIFV